MPKDTVITFKIDGKLKEILDKQQENRSLFIRAAIINQLDIACPYCKGTGINANHNKPAPETSTKPK
jgi:hypothetical protein